MRKKIIGVTVGTSYNPYKLKEITSNDLFPIGAIYMSVSDISPASFIGGTWERIKDRFLLAAGDDYATGSMGGSADAIVVSHDHKIWTGEGGTYSNSYVGFSGGSTPAVHPYASFEYVSDKWGVSTHLQAKPTGEDGTGKNMPPYLAVYMWVRIA